ncbi:MAG: glycoside hydrolase family 97 protein [Anaerolineae bacterium]|nr:glycoside hydrolase family 97 protein [Anaerolineae bacterium]
MDGAPYYAISREGNDVILPSRLGFVFSHEAPLRQNFALAASETQSVDEVWTQPWGEVKEIRNHYNELHVALTETTNAPRILHLTFRAFDDGVGFRYEIPEQAHLTDFEILDEETEFILAGNHQSWWIPAYGDNRYEYLYTQSPISDLDIVHTPLTMATAEGLYLSIHEAALTDYSSMTLWHTGDATLLCDLVPWSDGVKVKATAPLKTPWRTIQIAETPGDLITSYLILNLNEPNRLTDVSWIHPGKYVGIWWGMHLGLNTWGSGPDHGATTENALRYMDFAADNGFAGVLIEGWNVGWDGDWTRYGDRFEFTTPYDDFDIETVATYAAERGVTLIGHHETGAAVQNYEEQMEEAFAFYRDLGVTTVKTGYVGWGQGIKRYNESGNLVGLEWHHGQHMVEHYRKVVETAADYQIMLIVHEPIKDTGIRRTYPNMMSREGARGQEYNAWDGEGGNPPDHTTILPFTRMLAGPMDFTPGIFDLLLEDADRPGNRINTTLAKQLALYVVLYSPHQMAADLPENYAGHPALQFIRDVPTDWETTQVLNGAIGDYITIARKDRASSDWYLGSITDEEGRTFEIPLTFLDEGRTYTAQVYADAETADWDYNPLAVQISEATVDRESTVTLKLAPGGGVAIRFHPETALD